MKTFKIVNDDLVFDEKGNLEMVEGVDEKIQSIERIITTNTNEWFLNTLHGLNYDEIQGKGKTIEGIRLALLEAVYQDERVTDVDFVNININRERRHLEVRFKVMMGDDVIESEEVLTLE